MGLLRLSFPSSAPPATTMMKQVLAIFVAGSHAATCTVASVQTGNTIAAADSSSLTVDLNNEGTVGCQTSGGLTGVAFPNAAGRCSVMCDGTLGVAASAAIPTKNVYVAFNPFDTTYGNSIITAANLVFGETTAHQYRCRQQRGLLRGELLCLHAVSSKWGNRWDRRDRPCQPGCIHSSTQGRHRLQRVRNVRRIDLPNCIRHASHHQE